MQHRSQRQCFSLYGIIVAACKEILVLVDILQNLVAVQNQRISLVPGLVQAVSPVFCAILVVGEVFVVAPYAVVGTDGVCTTHHLNHLYRQRLAVECIAVEVDVDTVEHFLVAFF